VELIALLALVLLALDFQNVLSHWRGWVLEPTDERTDDFTVLVPLWGDPKYFRNREHLEPRKHHVLLCLDVSSPRMREWSDQAERDGWRVFRTVCRFKPSGPSELCLRALRSGLVTTTYALRVDADTYTSGDPGRAVAAVARSGADIASVKVVPHKPDSTVEHLQKVEYRMSMLSRHFRPWQTSGACIIGTRDALTFVLARHSHWFPGEDMETGRVASHYRMKIRHLDFEVTTEVPDTWRSLFRQRRMWWAGNFRHVVINADSNIRMPVWTLYYVLLVYVLAAGKLATFMGKALHALPMILLVYTVITVVANWQVRDRWMIAYPYYALVQAAFLPPLGIVYYVRMAWRRRTVGRYRIGLRRPPAYRPGAA
jgi:cellulose synthase/poly-beta-1,6-N-acetylglucosamine synthase-like glycosyltransferase